MSARQFASHAAAHCALPGSAKAMRNRQVEAQEAKAQQPAPEVPTVRATGFESVRCAVIASVARCEKQVDTDLLVANAVARSGASTEAVQAEIDRLVGLGVLRCATRPTRGGQVECYCFAVVLPPELS